MESLMNAWFARITPRLVFGGGWSVGLETETLYANGGTFHSQPSDVPLPSVLEQVQLEGVLPQEGKAVSVTCVVTHVQRADEKRFRVGLLFLSLDAHQGTWPAGLDLEGIPAPTKQAPLAWAAHPWFFNSRLHFAITGFGRDRVVVEFEKGIRGITEGLPLQLQLILPGVGSYSLPAIVERLDIGKGVEVSRAVLFLPSLEGTTKEEISRYLLLHSPDLSVQALQSLGYPFPNLEYASVLGFARSEADVAKVLALRFLAYSERPDSRFPKDAGPGIMRDAYDDHSLLLTLSVGKRLVGTTRLVFNNGDRSKSEIAAAVELPNWLWEAGFLELSRSATDPQMRGRDIFANLRRHALRIAYQCGYSYILADCEPHLLAPYKKRGAQELGVSFVHPLENKRLHVVFYDVKALTQGSVGDRSTWETFWKPMADFLVERHPGHP